MSGLQDEVISPNEDSEDESQHDRNVRPLGALYKYGTSRYSEYRTYPISTTKLSRGLWRAKILRETEKALSKAVLRRDWERAALLLLGLMRKVYRRSMTFKENYLGRHAFYAYSTELYFFQIMSFIDGGEELQEEFLQDMISDKDYIKCCKRSFYYIFRRLIKLLSERQTREALEISHSVAKLWRFRMTRYCHYAVMMRMLVRYVLWHEMMHEKKLEIKKEDEQEQERISMRFNIGAFDYFDTDIKDLAVKSLSDFTKTKNILSSVVCAQYIRCQLLCWLNQDSSEALNASQETVMNCMFHSDAHLLRMFMILLHPQFPKENSQLLQYLSSFLSCNPHEEGAAILLNNISASHLKNSNIQIACQKNFLIVLDSCHPELHSLVYCITQWNKFLNSLTSETMLCNNISSMEVSLRDAILVLLESRLEWWRKYFFSPIALRCMTTLCAHNDELYQFLNILGLVSCHLYGPDNHFCHELCTFLPREWQIDINGV